MHTTDVITTLDSGLRPTLTSVSIAGDVVTLVYDLAASASAPETSSVLTFTFEDDHILYETVSRAPNAVYASYMRATTDLAWSEEWSESGAILPGGALAPGDDGTLLDPYQLWEVVETYGVYHADDAASVAQVRLAQGAQVNYLDDGDWTVDADGATTRAVFNTFLDTPTGGFAQPLWTRDALVFAPTASEAAARMVALAATAAIPSRASLDEQVVIALADTGINPYHIAFRDSSALAQQHPSTYIAGYPADAEALVLTLSAPDVATALAVDADAWAAVEANKLYWIPGTKIVGLRSSGVFPENETQLGFSVGHGTMTASRAAANEYSLCPECRIVAIQAGNILESDGSDAIRWAAEQEWIDVQSHSWSGFVPFQNEVEIPGVRDAMEFAAAQMPVFTSGGNGASGKLGVLGHPAFTRPMGGAKGAIPVGGHDNGFVTAWTSQYPYVVADACSSWAAVGTTVDTFDPEEGGGTSAATPYSAGEAGRLILEARRMLGDDGDRADGVLAQGAPRPDLGASPLADGVFTLDELKSVVFRTATARPAFTRDDGALCGSALHTPSNTLPLAWSQYPDEVSAYPFIGWGGIDVTSLGRALDVLHGAPMPVRPVDEEAHAQAEVLRDTWRAAEPDTGPLPTEDDVFDMLEGDDAGSGGDAPDDAPSGVSIESGVAYEGRMAVVWLFDFADLYAFEAQAGDVVDLKIAAIQGCAHLIQPDGSPTGLSACADAAGFLPDHLTQTVTQSGTHHLQFSSNVEQRYSFAIGVNEPAPDVAIPAQL